MLKFSQKCDEAEKQIEALSKELELLKTFKDNPPLDQNVPEELSQLRSENNKLKYRLNIVKRATAKEAKNANVMKNINNILIETFREAVSAAFPDIPDAPCPILPSAKFGDYQFNGAMAISGLLKASGIKVKTN